MLIIISNPRRPLNRALAVYIASTFLWLLTNLLTNIAADQEVSLFFARTTLIGAALIPYTFYIFCNYFVAASVGKRKFILWGILPFIIILTTPTVLNIVSIESFGRDTVIGPIYILLIAELIIYPLLGIVKLVRYTRTNGATPTQITQVKYIAVGGLLTLVPGIIANAIMPLIGYPNTVFFGPNVVMILAIFTSLAIIKHKLLDIRALVARSLTYTLLLISILAVYVIFVFGFARQLGESPLERLARDMIPFVAAMLLVVVYVPTKRFFDRITNRVFYQDAYETKELLDEFNQTIVATIELKKLLDKSVKVIEKYLKPEFVSFSLLQKDEGIRLFNEDGTKLSDKLVDQVRSYVKNSRQKVYITDVIRDDQADLKLLLQQENIGALIRITKNTNIEGIGYMLLGYKKSGSIYNSQDEGAMETVANELVIAIDNALQYEEIQNFAATLQAKVDEATKNLRKANEKLKQMDQTKDDFISMASHQLRTPLTSVKGYVSMVLEGDAGKVNTKQKELLTQAFVSSQRMVYLIADLLNVSRLRTGKFVIEAKPTNLAEVVGGEIAQLKETAKGRNLSLAYSKPKNFPELMLDETKIRQVVMNFADNAIYYTPAGGHIEVKVEDTGESIEFRVTDDGIGVPKSEQHHLFGKFYRAGNARKARPDGTGLGLFMAKKVVVTQGGSIIFKSQEGRGSTFGFSFAKKPLLPDNYKGPINE